MSWRVCAIGVVFGTYVLYTNKKRRIFAMAIYFYALMELLQALQYRVIDQCDSKINKVLSFLTFFHVCVQPIVMNLFIAEEMQHKPEIQKRFYFVVRLCIVAAIALLLRGSLEIFGFTKSVRSQCEASQETELFRSTKLCTTSGIYHSVWQVPLADNSYWLPSLNIHLFFFFVPQLVQFDEPELVFKGLFTLFSGPVILAYLLPNQLGEQGTIWCFFSIFYFLLVYVIDTFMARIRETESKKD
jgi:hypothetical protein